MTPHSVHYDPNEPATKRPPFAVRNHRSELAALCFEERDATRIAKALDLLDDIEKLKPGERKANGNYSIATGICPEAEIMQRAREAAISEAQLREDDTRDMRDGKCDDWLSARTAARALRDLAKPLSELAPAVDPDLAEARKMAATNGRWLDPGAVLRGEQDGSPVVKIAVDAIKRGRDLAIDDLLTEEGKRRLSRG